MNWHNLSIRGVLGILALFGISFAMLRSAVLETNVRQGEAEHVGVYGFLLFLSTLGGTIGYTIAGKSGIVRGAVVTILLGFIALAAIYRHRNLNF